MDKPSIMNVFESEYSNKNISHKKQILIDVNSLINKDKQWLPGAEEFMGVLSGMPETTEIIVHNVKFSESDLKVIFRKSRVFCDIESDPVNLSNYDIIISPKTGFSFIDFPYVKEFLEKVEYERRRASVVANTETRANDNQS